jgi:hypothetical protein
MQVLHKITNYKLQNCKFTISQVCKFANYKINKINHKSQITTSQITILQFKFIILIKNIETYNMTISHNYKLQN